MKYMLRFIACAGLLVSMWYRVDAQYSNPILTTSSDAQGAALAGLSTLSEQMPLYALPSLALTEGNKAEKLRLSYTLGLTPIGGQSHKQYLHSLAGTYRLQERHALMLGGRYWQGAPIEYIGATGSRLGRIHPQDFTIDIAYAYTLLPQVKVFAGVSYLNTYSSQTSHSVMGHAGLTYEGRVRFLEGGRYLLATSVRNLGSSLQYGKDKKTSSSLPTYFETAARLNFAPIVKHELQLGLGLRYYTSVLGEQAFVCQVATEYKLADILNLRLGGVYQADNSRMTLGLGKDLGRFNLHVAYSLHTYSEFNVLSTGLSFSL